MIDDNSLKTQDIRLKLVSFDSIRLSLRVNIKIMYLSLKNNFLFSKEHRLSCLSLTEYCIWIWSMKTLWKLKIFASKLTHSIAFVYLYKVTSKTCIFPWKIITYSRWNVEYLSYRLPNRTGNFGYVRWWIFEISRYSHKTSLFR